MWALALLLPAAPCMAGPDPLFGLQVRTVLNLGFGEGGLEAD